MPYWRISFSCLSKLDTQANRGLSHAHVSNALAFSHFTASWRRSVIELGFKCGHRDKVGESMNTSPVCTTCGERQITYVKPSRMPRFTGTVTGPCATFTKLEPGVVDCAPSGPLKLKDLKESE